MVDEHKTRSQTLGAFLRAHRERLSPDVVGVALARRRRTPGLRREELAQLCEVSTTWYTWLEQGRPVVASAAVLVRMAAALRLSRAETSYLFEMGRPAISDEPELQEPAVSADLKALVEQLPFPAYVLDRQWNAVTWNRKAAKLFAPWLVGSDDRQLLRFVFLNPAAPTLIVDWKDRARRLVAEFRADVGKHLNEPPTLRLIAELQSRSRLFAQFWSEQDVRAREGGERTFCSGQGQQSVYSQMSLMPANDPDLKLVLLVPCPGQLKRRPPHQP